MAHECLEKRGITDKRPRRASFLGKQISESTEAAVVPPGEWAEFSQASLPQDCLHWCSGRQPHWGFSFWVPQMAIQVSNFEQTATAKECKRGWRGICGRRGPENAQAACFTRRRIICCGSIFRSAEIVGTEWFRVSAMAALNHTRY